MKCKFCGAINKSKLNNEGNFFDWSDRSIFTKTIAVILLATGGFWWGSWIGKFLWGS